MTQIQTTTNVRDSLIQMFLDGTEGEVYADGRLKTVRDGSLLRLIAYHREVIAEYDEQTSQVIIHSGHYGNISETVDRYLARTANLAKERDARSVILTELSDVTRMRPISSRQYTGQYVDTSRPPSGADKKAMRDVRVALRTEA